MVVPIIGPFVPFSDLFYANHSVEELWRGKGDQLLIADMCICALSLAKRVTPARVKFAPCWILGGGYHFSAGLRIIFRATCDL